MVTACEGRNLFSCNTERHTFVFMSIGGKCGITKNSDTVIFVCFIICEKSIDVPCHCYIIMGGKMAKVLTLKVWTATIPTIIEGSHVDRTNINTLEVIKHANQPYWSMLVIFQMPRHVFGSRWIQNASEDHSYVSVCSMYGVCLTDFATRKAVIYLQRNCHGYFSFLICAKLHISEWQNSYMNRPKINYSAATNRRFILNTSVSLIADCLECGYMGYTVIPLIDS